MFSADLSYEDKLDALKNEFKISVGREMSEEVQSVCNLSVGVYNKGLSAGRMEQAKETAYKLQDMELPIEKIAYAVEAGIDTVREWLAEREELLVK